MPGPWEKYAAAPPADSGPWSKYQNPSSDTPGIGRSLAAGAADSGTLGYLPEIEAAANKGLIKASDFLTGGNLEKTLGDQASYEGLKKSYTSDLGQDRAAHPTAFTVGQVGGGLAQTPVIAAGLGKVGLGVARASMAGRVAQGAAAGGVQGLVQNPGENPQDQSPGQLLSRLQNARTGALLGGGGQALGEGIGAAARGISKAASELKGVSSALALKQVGASKRDFKALYKSDKIDDMAQFIKEKDLISGAPKPDEVLNRVNAVKEEAGQKIGQIYEGINQADIKVNPEELVDELLKTASSSKARPSLSSNSQAFDKKMLQVIEDVSKKGDGLKDVRQVNDIIREIDKDINYSKMNKERDEIQNGLYEIRDRMRGYVNDLADQVGQATGSPDLKKQLMQANRDYSYSSKIQALAQDKASSNAVNRMLSLTDYKAGIGSGILGGLAASRDNPEDALKKGLLMGAGGALLNRGARRYGPGILSQAGNAAGGLIAPAQAISNAATLNPVLIGSGLGTLANDRKKK